MTVTSTGCNFPQSDVVLTPRCNSDLVIFFADQREDVLGCVLRHVCSLPFCGSHFFVINTVRVHRALSCYGSSPLYHYNRVIHMVGSFVDNWETWDVKEQYFFKIDKIQMCSMLQLSKSFGGEGMGQNFPLPVPCSPASHTLLSRFPYPALPLPVPCSPTSHAFIFPLSVNQDVQNTSESFSCAILRRFLYRFPFVFTLAPLTRVF